jgi:hypothetical protein
MVNGLYPGRSMREERLLSIGAFGRWFEPSTAHSVLGTGFWVRARESKDHGRYAR